MGNRWADIYARHAADLSQITGACAEALAKLDKKTSDVVTRLLESNKIALQFAKDHG